MSKYEDWPKQDKSIVYAVDGMGNKILIDKEGNPILDEDDNYIILDKPKVH